MKVFALDPGVSKAGWSILEDGQILDFGIFSPKSRQKAFNDKINEEIQTSLKFFEEKLEGVDAVAWEIVPSFGRMSQRDRVVAVATSLKVVTWQKELPWVGMSPRRVKSLATGDSKASKEKMKDRVYELYPDMPIVDEMPVDVFDSILIGTVALEQGRWN